MKQKLSVEVLRRKSQCEIVLGAVRIQRQRITASIGEVLDPVLQPEETLPDFDLVIELYGRTLELHGSRMVEADEAHRRQLTRDAELRGRRGELKDHLKATFLTLRATCLGVFGESSLAVLGLDVNLAQNAKGVLEQARIVRDRLRNPDLELVPARFLTGTIEPEDLARELDDGVETLARTLREIVDHRKTAEMTLVAKHEAIEAFDAVFLRFAQGLESTFRIAGEVELADRIRPTVRRLTRPGEDHVTAASSLEPPAEPSTIGLAAVPHSHDVDDQDGVIDRVQHPMRSNPDSPEIQRTA
jgi:hypothetical protein